jgi:hypothetical protein
MPHLPGGRARPTPEFRGQIGFSFEGSARSRQSVARRADGEMVNVMLGLIVVITLLIDVDHLKIEMPELECFLSLMVGLRESDP